MAGTHDGTLKRRTRKRDQNGTRSAELQAVTQFLDQAPYGVFAVDRSLRVCLWNLWLAQRSHRAADQVLGRPLLDLYPELRERGMARYFQEVLDTGQPVVLSYRFHKYLLPLRERPDDAPMPQTARLLPWYRGQEIIGVIAFLEDLREQVASEEELRRHIELSDSLRLIDRAILTAKTADESLRVVAERAMALTRADRAIVFRREGERLVGRVMLGDMPAGEQPVEARVGEGVCGRVAETGRTEMVLDRDEDASRDGMRSVIAAPVRLNGSIWGVLCLKARAANAFDSAEREMAERLAEEAALAVHYAQLREQEEAYVQTLTRLYQASLVLTSSLDLQSALDELAKQVVLLVGADRAYVFLYDDETDKLTFGAGPGIPGAPRRQDYEPRPYGLTYRVARRGEVVIVNDPEHHPLLGPEVAQRLKAAAGLPLLYRGRVLGVLSVFFTKPHTIDDKEERLLRLLADQAANAIANARLHETVQEELARRREAESTLRQRVAELEALVRLSRELAAKLDVEKLLNQVLDAAVEAIPTAERGWIALVEEDAEGLVVRATFGRSALPYGARLSFQDARVVPAVRDRSPWLVRDGRALGPCEEDALSAIVAPLLVQDRVIGVIHLDNLSRSNAFQVHDLSLLAAIANQAALAVEKTRLLQREQRARARAEALNAIIVAATSQSDLKSLLEAALDHTLRALNLECGAVWFSERLMAVRNLPTDIGEAIVVASEMDNFTVERPHSVVDWARVRKYRHLREVLVEAGVRASIAVPLRMGTGRAGTLAVGAAEPRQWRQDEVALVEAVGRQIGAAVERVRLLEEERARARELELLNRVIAAATSTLDVNEVMRAAVHELAEAFAVPYVAVAQLNREREAAWTIMAIHQPPDKPPGEGLSLHLPELAAHPPTTVVSIDDPVNEPKLAPIADLLRAGGIQSLLMVPLTVREYMEGVIGLADTTKRDWTPSEKALLQSAATVITQAIENARLHEMVRAQATVLEMRVAERTAELEQALQARSEFLAMISHELRTPLNSILGFGHMLASGQAGELSERARRYVDHIITSGEHLLSLINNLLDMARIEAGKFEIHRERLSIEALVKDAVTMFKPRAAEKGLVLIADIEEDLPFVSADPLRIRQVLYNLLDNAIKFTRTGAVRVQARLAQSREDLPPGAPEDVTVPCIAVSVIDTGVGIAPEDQERVFSPFEQLANPLVREQPGTGLGLALSRQLVELHGGRIWVESKPGKGSTFTFTLPLEASTDASGTGRE